MLARLKIIILIATLFILSFFSLELLARARVGSRFRVWHSGSPTADDLHFSAYHKEPSGVWIIAAMIDVRGLGTARIDGFVAQSTTRGLPDGRIHGYDVDATGSIPGGG